VNASVGGNAGKLGAEAAVFRSYSPDQRRRRLLQEVAGRSELVHQSRPLPFKQEGSIQNCWLMHRPVELAAVNGQVPEALNPHISRIYLGPEGSRWGEWTPQELRLGAGVVYR
jgi:hypothetical protein